MEAECECVCAIWHVIMIQEQLQGVGCVGVVRVWVGGCR